MVPNFLRRSQRRILKIGIVLLLAVLFVISGAHPQLRRIVRVNYNYYIADGGPPKYTALRKWEAALPQHNLSLPFPEGNTGRYVKFSNQIRRLGWNNCFGDVLMNAHLAYSSGRGYVFRDYEWAAEHYNWREEQWVTLDARTPLNAIVSGPVAGGAFGRVDPAPRAISEAWFDVVCPRRERRYINTGDVKPAVAEAPGVEVLAHWKTLLRDAPERCIEIVEGKEDSFPQTFDLRLWTSPRLLTLWDALSQSPISRLLSASPIVHAAVNHNMYLFLPRGARPPHPVPRDPFRRMLAIHLRRGDYEGHCGWMAYINNGFYGWSQFEHLPDRFVPEPDAPGKDERFLARCWPDVAAVVTKVAEARRDYLGHAADLDRTLGSATLDVIYVLTNDKSEWIGEVRKALFQDGWTVATSQDLVLDTEQTDVSMAVDMEIARRAEVFVGNGWSSLTSNIVYQRLLDLRDPITIRFT
ncbi:hypothetical protein B0H11DRAFT_2036669 [Mycena galericulata]|nr:hypothetical protein B0H11DRAFT_2036669 [Mycena galericulata]